MPDKNYNEQWSFAASDASEFEFQSGTQSGHIRVMNEHRKPGLCLDAKDGALPGSPVTIADCDPKRSAEQVWMVASDSTPPAIQIIAAAPSPAAGQNLCLTAASAQPAPAPAPAPPGGERGCLLANTTSLPFCDTSLSMEARAKDLVSRMTLDEKLVQLIGGIGGGITPATPRLGVPAYQYHSEGLHGLRDSCLVAKQAKPPLYSTTFPQVTAMAATFNMTLVGAMAGHMADEARAVNNYLKGVPDPSKGGGLNYWGPTMNVCRDPRWGRCQESVSEDPFLNGAYSQIWVKQFQGTDDSVKCVLLLIFDFIFCCCVTVFVLVFCLSVF